MKNFIIFFLLVFMSVNGFSDPLAGTGTDIAPERMTTKQRNDMSKRGEVPNGKIVYTTDDPNLSFYDGDSWDELAEIDSGTLDLGSNKLQTSETVAGSGLIRLQHAGNINYTSGNELAGANSNWAFVDLQGDFNWGAHINITAGADNSKAFVGGAHATDSKVLVADIDAAGTSVISGYQNNVGGDGTQNMIELFGATEALGGATVGTFDGDFLDFRNAGNARLRFDADGVLRIFDTTGADTVQIKHDGTSSIFNSDVGNMVFSSSNGVLQFAGVDGTNNDAITIDFETVNNRPIWSSGTGVTDFFWAFGLTASFVNANRYIHTPGTIAADDATPDVSGASVLTTTANTGATAITDLDNPTVGQVVHIIGGSNTNSSTIADSGNFNLSAAFTASLDDVLILYVQADNDYIEIGRVNN